MSIVYRVNTAVYLINLQLTQTDNACIELLHLFFKRCILLKKN